MPGEATMRVRELMTRDPEACMVTQSCAEAGEIMRRRRCGFVPVLDSWEGQRVIGVVTDRDLALWLTWLDQPASQVPLGMCMTDHPQTIDPDVEFEIASELMQRHAIHRLPVVESGRLVGVLSLQDLALEAKKEWAHVGPHRMEQQIADIVEAIAAKHT